MELYSVVMTSAPQTLKDQILITMKDNELHNLFTDINWSAIFKDETIYRME
jgi:hypothetical protein